MVNPRIKFKYDMGLDYNFFINFILVCMRLIHKKNYTWVEGGQ